MEQVHKITSKTRTAVGQSGPRDESAAKVRPKWEEHSGTQLNRRVFREDAVYSELGPSLPVQGSRAKDEGGSQSAHKSAPQGQAELLLRAFHSATV